MISTSLDVANPKDVIGQAKIDLTLFPGVAIAHGSHALMDGLDKYKERANWRNKPVRASIYMAAALRHGEDYMDGEDRAADSGVHHLGHMLACIAIVLDAMECGTLIDDRAANPGAMSAVLARLNEQVKSRRESQNFSAA
jgi:hypothetical protein